MNKKRGYMAKKGIAAYWERLTATYKELAQSNLHFVLIGDFNMHATYDENGRVISTLGSTQRLGMYLRALTLHHSFQQKNTHPNSDGNFLDLLLINYKADEVTARVATDEDVIKFTKVERHHKHMVYEIPLP